MGWHSADCAQIQLTQAFLFNTWHSSSFKWWSPWWPLTVRQNKLRYAAESSTSLCLKGHRENSSHRRWDVRGFHRGLCNLLLVGAAGSRRGCCQVGFEQHVWHVILGANQRLLWGRGCDETVLRRQSPLTPLATNLCLTWSRQSSSWASKSVLFCPLFSL